MYYTKTLHILHITGRKPSLKTLSHLSLPEGSTWVGFGPLNTMAFSKKSPKSLFRNVQNGIEGYVFVANRYIEIINKLLPENMEHDCAKHVTVDGDIVLRKWTRELASTVVYDTSMTVQKLRRNGEFGYLAAVTEDRYLYTKWYEAGWQVDVYSAADHKKLTTPGETWGHVTCCAGEQGDVVVADKNNKCLHFYNSTGI